MMRPMLWLTAAALLTGCGKKDAPAEGAPAAPAPPAAAATAGATAPAPLERRGPDEETEGRPSPNAPPAEAGVPAASPAAGPGAPESAEERALAAGYAERACILKRQDRQGIEALDERLGFKGSGDFATRWAAAAAKNPEWAETTMAAALAAPCQPAAAPAQ